MLMLGRLILVSPSHVKALGGVIRKIILMLVLTDGRWDYQKISYGNEFRDSDWKRPDQGNGRSRLSPV
jgi:hypothetical protein